MASLLELVQDTLTPDIIGKITNLVGETPAATESALRRAAPAVLAGVADNASTAEGAEHMRSLVRDGGWGADLLNNLGSRLGDGDATSGLVAAGTNLLASLFGRNADGVVDVISRDVRVRPGSASTILSLAAPIVMSVLGKQMASRGLSASGLAEMLGAERGSLLAALPAGLSGLLGLRGSAAETLPRERVIRAAEPDVGRPSRTNWWPALLAGLAALAFLAFFVSRGHRPDVTATRGDIPSAAPRPVASVTLPDGARISVDQASPVHQLSSFLTNGSATELPKRFVFDDLQFETGSTRLTSEGQRTVNALLAVLKAYPSVQIALEGHTDGSGDAAANKTLSEQRAAAVKQTLVDGGVAANRIRAEGYGQERPIADNTSDAGRARNRRLELVVTQR